jgi:hypothetical protein
MIVFRSAISATRAPEKIKLPCRRPHPGADLNV